MSDDARVRAGELTEALVHHLRDCFAQYPEATVFVPEFQEEFQTDGDEQFRRWLASAPGFPDRLPVGICSRAALEGKLAHALEQVRDEHAVLVVCDLGGGHAEGLSCPDHVDLVEVRHASEIAGAVVEALAGDVPMVVDVRLTEQQGAGLLG
ncbi:hypothetical protein [Kineococcus sp. SYSU DK003]|uniref:hypothetical protein n=1 Tax=Kineococcus sp. SYSU DK003 TaxID=3383124 RepID=UPI003D7EE5F6